MRKIHGYKLESLPIEGLERVSNLIEFEGPLLSHYKDKFDNHYLYYWVDHSETENRWLIWGVQQDLLDLYLVKELPLDSLFPKNNETLYVVDIDSSIEPKKVFLTYAGLVDEDYKPEVDAYFEFDIPIVYEERVQTKEYFKILKERALYFNLESVTNRYDKTISIDDIWKVLQNLGNSFAEYVQHNVGNILISKLYNTRRALEAAKSLSSAQRLRVCYLNLNSFHVGIAADSINLKDDTMDPDISDFKQEVMTKFKNEVLDNDFTSKEDVSAILEKFPDEEVRRKIFDPILKIINNENITVHINDYSEKFDKNYKKVPKQEREIIAPPRKGATKDFGEPEFGVRVAYFIVDKKDENTLFPKDVNKVLFVKDAEGNKFPIEVSKITLPDGMEVNLTRTIEAEAVVEKGNFILEYAPLEIIIVSEKREKLQEKFNSEIIRLYSEFINGSTQYATFFKEFTSR